MDIHLSQVPCLAFESESLTIALEKFSFAVTPIGIGNHQWVHDTRKDKLILVVRQVQPSQGNAMKVGQLLMSVTVGAETLECQDLSKLAAIVESFERHRVHGPIDRGVEPPVHVVVKFPCIALRYPTSQALRRRIQMRLKDENDYQRVISVFERLKFPIHNAANRDVSIAPVGYPRPASTSLTQNLSHSYSKDLILLPDTVNSYRNGVSSTVSNAQHPLSKPLLIEDSPFFRQSHTASSETMRPISSLSCDDLNACDMVSLGSLGEQLVRSKSVLGNVGNYSSVLESQIGRKPLPPTMSHSILGTKDLVHPVSAQVNDQNALFSSIKSAAETFGPPLRKTQASSANTTWSGSAFELVQSSRATTVYGNLTTDTPDTNKQTEIRMSLVPDFLRPVSAPVQSAIESSSQSLPPKRELPFAKARRAPKFGTECVDKTNFPQSDLRCDEAPAGQSSLFVPPQSVTPAFNHNVKRIAQRRPNLLSPLVRDDLPSAFAEESMNSSGGGMRSPLIFAEREEAVSPLARKGAAVARPSTAPGLQSKVTNSTTRKRSSGGEHDTEPVNKRARNMVDRATQTQTLSGRDHTVPLDLTIAGGRPRIPTVDEAVHPPDLFLNEIEAFVSKHKQRPAPKELWQRPGYAEASPEERQTIINDFICENLDNEDFIKLCEDTGNVWRRIGLEL